MRPPPQIRGLFGNCFHVVVSLLGAFARAFQPPLALMPVVGRLQGVPQLSPKTALRPVVERKLAQFGFGAI